MHASLFCVFTLLQDVMIDEILSNAECLTNVIFVFRAIQMEIGLMTCMRVGHGEIIQGWVLPQLLLEVVLLSLLFPTWILVYQMLTLKYYINSLVLECQLISNLLTGAFSGIWTIETCFCAL